MIALSPSPPPSPPPPSPPLPPWQPAIGACVVFDITGSDYAGRFCDDTCTRTSWRSDGVCDDGGPGSEYDDCAFGTDCTDCGPRGGEPGKFFNVRHDCFDGVTLA